MNSISRPKINILLVGLSEIGKTWLCQAFGSNFIDYQENQKCYS